MPTPMSPRQVTSSLAAAVLVLTMAAAWWLALVNVAAARQPAIFSLGPRGGIEIRLEVDRSPDCPSGLVSMCDMVGTGPRDFSAWLYTSPTPNSRMAQVLVAFPVGPLCHGRARCRPVAHVP